MAVACCLRSLKHRSFQTQIRHLSLLSNHKNIINNVANQIQTIYPISTPSIRLNFSKQLDQGRCFSSAIDRNVDVTYEDLEALLRSRDIQLIDVREPNELIEFGKIPGAVNIPLGQLQSALEMPDKDFTALYGAKKPNIEDKNVVFHCMIGGRSLKAVELAEKLGYNKARHYKGGWEEYAKKTGQPLKKNCC